MTRRTFFTAPLIVSQATLCDHRLATNAAGQQTNEDDLRSTFDNCQ